VVGHTVIGDDLAGVGVIRPRLGVGMSRLDLGALAQRVYDLHRDRDVRRGRSRTRIPTWVELDEPTRSRLIATYWRARAQYDAGRSEPREVDIVTNRARSA
jgi:hypothetical protein